MHKPASPTYQVDTFCWSITDEAGFDRADRVKRPKICSIIHIYVYRTSINQIFGPVLVALEPNAVGLSGFLRS